jgi:hypothetical protein
MIYIIKNFIFLFFLFLIFLNGNKNKPWPFAGGRVAGEDIGVPYPEYTGGGCPGP